MSDNAIPANRTESVKIIFAGTPDLAVPTLRALADSSHDVALVITQPDRRAGRGRKLTPPPVKTFAESRGIRVLQPVSINRPEAVAEMRAVEPDAIVCFAYGKRFTPRVLDLPRIGCFNIHASLLPRYRGAAPINYAILNGDAKTGVTVQRMAAEIDTGPVLAQESFAIGAEETAGELSERVAEAASRIIVPTLDDVEIGNTGGIPQDDALAMEAPSLRKEDGVVPWQRSAEDICRLIRAMTPWPGAFTFYHASDGRDRARLIILSARSVADPGPAVAKTFGTTAEPGLVVCTESRLLVAAGEGFVELRSVKPAGSKGMDALSFLRGHNVCVGDRFCE